MDINVIIYEVFDSCTSIDSTGALAKTYLYAHTLMYMYTYCIYTPKYIYIYMYIFDVKINVCIDLNL